jgi:hypothetical protein
MCARRNEWKKITFFLLAASSKCHLMAARLVASTGDLPHTLPHPSAKVPQMHARPNLAGAHPYDPRCCPSTCCSDKPSCADEHKGSHNVPSGLPTTAAKPGAASSLLNPAPNPTLPVPAPDAEAAAGACGPLSLTLLAFLPLPSPLPPLPSLLSVPGSTPRVRISARAPCGRSAVARAALWSSSASRAGTAYPCEGAGRPAGPLPLPCCCVTSSGRPDASHSTQPGARATTCSAAGGQGT